MWSLVAIVGIAAIAAAVILSRRRAPIVDEAASHRVDVSTELGEFIRVVNSVNDVSDPEYLKCVEKLQASADLILADAARLFAADSHASFAIRHSTLLALGALKLPSALDLLSAVALNPQPLPPVDSASPAIDVHRGAALEAGTILSLDALEAIEALAGDGHADALEVLVRAADVESNPVRAFAFAALATKAEWTGHFARAEAALPRDRRYLAKARRTALGDVAQIQDPRDYLAGQEKGVQPPPHLQDDPSRDAAVAAEHGAPKAPRR